MLPADGGIPHTHGLSGISYLARRELHEKPGWNVIEVIARGDRAEHRLNGHLLCQLEKARQPNPDSKGEFVPLTQGRILLEIEAAEMFFRNIDIKLLNPL